VVVLVVQRRTQLTPVVVVVVQVESFNQRKF
jgi:hypothetical protein